MIPNQFDRFELAGKIYVWAAPRIPTVHNDEFGLELWRRRVGPRKAVTDLIRDNRGNWFLVHQDNMFNKDKTYRKISEQQAAILLQQSGAAIPAEALDTNGDDRKAARTKGKRSTQKGDAREKLIAALTEHHKYADGGCENWEPIGNNELARAAGKVARSSAKAFFDKFFEGHAHYKTCCTRNTKKVLNVLKSMNGDFSVEDSYGDAPPGERDR